MSSVTCFDSFKKVQGRSFAFVINPPTGQGVEWLNSVLLDLKDYFPCRGFSYWAILHDCDFDDENNLKTPHIHLVVKRGNPTRASVVINIINDLTDNPKGELPPWLSCDLVCSLRGAVRYLVHLDNPDKQTYFPDEIYSNNMAYFFDCCAGELEVNTSYLLDVIYQANGSRSVIAKVLGLETYNRLRNTINDFIKEGCF